MRPLVSIVGSATLILILIGQPAGSQTAVPVGDQVQVNTYTTGYQGSPAVGVDGEGNMVVVWMSPWSNGTDTDETSIQSRVYTSNGVPVGREVQVNTYTTRYQGIPKVAVEEDGDFVVVWFSIGSSGSDTSDFSVQGQRYRSNGSRAGGQFQVNTYTTGLQDYPAVAVDNLGHFVVVWYSEGSAGDDNSGTSIQGQRYMMSDGSTVGGEFQVNSDISGNQSSPDVGMNSDGAFVVVWHSSESSGSDTLGSSVHGRAFHSTGLPVAPQVQANTYTTSEQVRPVVGVNADGAFAVVWRSDGSGGDDSDWDSIQRRFFTSSGIPVGPEEQINTYTTSDQREPNIGVGANGDFVVVWRSYGSGGDDSDGFSVQAQPYASDGSPAGSEIQVNTYTTSDQQEPAVATDADGDFFVVWTSLGSGGDDGDGRSIQGQRFAVRHIFSDGFESGATTEWSSSVP